MIDPQNKVNVEFPSSKKMKKRRELDALVCNGKVRRKSKSGHELLRTESDSSDIDEFSIAAQRTLFRNRGRSSCSSCKTALIFLMIGICLVILSGLIWLHFDMKNTVQSLQDKLAFVERKNQDSTLVIGKFQPQIDELKKEILGVKSLDTVKFKALDSQIDLLNKSSSALQSVVNVKSQEDLNKKLEQLTQIPIISKTVAQIGSDVESLKTKIDSLTEFKQKAEGQLTEISQKMLQADDREGQKHDNADNDDLSMKFQALQQSLGDVNISMWRHMNDMNSVLSGHQTRFEVLENKTQNLQSQISLGLSPSEGATSAASLVQIEDNIKQIVHQMIPNMTEGVSDSSLESIINNMENITGMVRSLKDQFVQLKSDHSEMVQPAPVSNRTDAELTEFRTLALNRLNTLNKTMATMSSDLSTLMGKFIKNQNMVTNLTRTVAGLTQYIHIMEVKVDNALNLTVGDDMLLANLPNPENINIDLDSAGNNTKEITTTPRPMIHMQLVKTEDDAILGLRRWDHNGNGVLDSSEIDDLRDYMPDPPEPSQLKQFDFDHNGSIDQNELLIALGFRPYPNEAERLQLAELG